MMKKKIIVSLALLATVSVLVWARWRPVERFELGAINDGAFRVVTWNVGYFAPVEDKNLRDVDIVHVSKILRETDAQVVILQELGKLEQAEQIADSVGDGWASYAVKTGHGDQVLAILTSLPVEFEEDVSCGGRKAKGITVRSDTGDSVYILGVHSPHPARGVSENLENITCSIEHVRSRGEVIRLVGGDLNYNFDAAGTGQLYSNIMEDFGDGTLEIGETYYAHTRIDHIFHYPKDLEILAKGSGMVDLGIRFAKVPGFRDHRPVVVSYKLN